MCRSLVTNGELTFATYCALDKEGQSKPIKAFHFGDELKNHVKILYHQDGIKTHCMRFAKRDEKPKNALKKWITPKLVQWNLLISEQRALLA